MFLNFYPLTSLIHRSDLFREEHNIFYYRLHVHMWSMSDERSIAMIVPVSC